MTEALRPPSDALLAELRALLGPSGVVDPADGARYFEEPRGKHRGAAALIARPATTEETAEIVRRAAQERVAIVPYGGGTGLVGGQLTGAAPAPIVVSMERMRAVRSVSVEDAALTIEAGAPLAAAQDAADAAGLLLPLSYASQGTASVGGALATNAGGVQVLRYGNARDLCLGIEAVLPSGEILHDLKTLRKDNTGFPVRQLLIGSEGALGLITAATLRLFPRPKARETAMLVLPSHRAAPPLLRRLQATLGDQITALELMSRTGLDFVLEHIDGVRSPFDAPADWYALVEASGPEGLRETFEAALAEGFEAGAIVDAVIAESEAQRLELWRIREETPIANRKVGAIASHDVSLPVSRISDFIDAAGAALAEATPRVRINCFGHVGDGNLHYNAFPPAGESRADWAGRAAEITRIVHDQVHAHGGSISAEHGIGRLKTGDLVRYGDPAKLAAMRAVKRALDPLGVMNPGVILPRDAVYGDDA